jgi:hypothetical protein
MHSLISGAPLTWVSLWANGEGGGDGEGLSFFLCLLSFLCYACTLSQLVVWSSQWSSLVSHARGWLTRLTIVVSVFNYHSIFFVKVGLTWAVSCCCVSDFGERIGHQEHVLYCFPKPYHSSPNLSQAVLCTPVYFSLESVISTCKF